MVNVLLLAIGLLAIGGYQVGATSCSMPSITTDCQSKMMEYMKTNPSKYCSAQKMVACCIGNATKDCPDVRQQFVLSFSMVSPGQNKSAIQNLVDLCGFNMTERIHDPRDPKTCMESTSPGDACTGTTPNAVVMECAQKNSIDMMNATIWSCLNVKPFYCCVAAGMAKCTSQHPVVVQMLKTKPSGTKTIDDMYNEKCKIKGTEVLKKPSDTCAPPSTSSFVTSSCLLVITSLLLAYF